MAAIALTFLVLGACAAGSPGPASIETDTERQASVTRTVLADSLVSARAYGQAHLGHFLGLNRKRLEREGLEVPPRISVKVKTTHIAFCITVVNGSLPSIHPWETATVASRDSRPSSEDRCER